MGIVDNLRNGISKLKPTDRSNVESELVPSDYGLNPPAQSEEMTRVGKLVDERFQAAYQVRRVHDPMYFDSLAMYIGNQWHRWSTGSNRYQTPASFNAPDRVFEIDNKILPIADSIHARAIAYDVTVQVKPKCVGLRIDIATAKQARSLVNHVQYVNKWRALLHECERYATIVGPCAVKIYYDKNAIVELPELDDDGNITGRVDRPVGEIRLDFVSLFDLYPDPKARSKKAMGWIIHAKRTPLEDIKAQYPDEGRYVTSDPNDGPASIVRNQIDNMTGDGNARGTTTAQKTAVLKELWEKPTTRYPDGRYIVSAGGRVLVYEEEWPYKNLTDFPFEWLMYREGIETIWGGNAISPIIGPQRTYNAGISKMREHMMRGDGFIMAPRGCNIDAGAYKSGARDQVVSHDTHLEDGTEIPAPQWIQGPQIDPIVTEVLHVMDGDMKGISSVNDVSQGMIPSANLSGAAIQSLQATDQSAGTIFRESIANFGRGVFQRVVEIGQEMYIEPRLLYVQDGVESKPKKAPNPMMAVGRNLGGAGGMGSAGMGQSAPQMPPGGPMGGGMPPGAGMPGMPPGGGPAGGPMRTAPGMPPSPMGGASAGQNQTLPPPPDLEAIMDGGEGIDPQTEAVMFHEFGEGRVIIGVVTASGQSQQARQQFIQGLAQAGALQPQNIPSTIVLLRALDIEVSDELYEELAAILPISVEVSRQLQASAPQGPSQMDILQLTSQLKMQEQAAQIQAESQAKLAVIQAQAAADAAKIQAQSQADMAAAQQKMELEFQKERLIRSLGAPLPTTSIAVKATPGGTNAAQEEAFGLEAVASGIGHAASMAAADPRLRDAVGMPVPPPPPVLPGATGTTGENAPGQPAGPQDATQGQPGASPAQGPAGMPPTPQVPQTGGM